MLSLTSKIGSLKIAKRRRGKTLEPQSSDPTPSDNLYRRSTGDTPLQDGAREVRIYDQFRKRSRAHVLIPNDDEPPSRTNDQLANIDTCYHFYFYANKRLALRRVSPRSEDFLKGAREQAASAIEHPTVIARAKVQALLQVLHSKTILLYQPSWQESKRARELEELMQYRLMSKFGDYQALYLKHLRKKGKERMPLESSPTGEALETLYQPRLVLTSAIHWTKIQNDIEKESANVKEWNKQKRPGPRPVELTSYSLSRTAQLLNFDPRLTFDTVALYSERNNLFHRGLEPLIDNCKWAELAQTIRDDLETLNSLHSVSDEVKRIYVKTIEALRDRWFIQIGQIEEQIVLSDEALEAEEKQLADRQTALERIRKEREENMAKEAAVREQKDRREIVSTIRRQGQRSSIWNDDDVWNLCFDEDRLDD